jgi:hypothetical protein
MRELLASFSGLFPTCSGTRVQNNARQEGAEAMGFAKCTEGQYPAMSRADDLIK